MQIYNLSKQNCKFVHGQNRDLMKGQNSDARLPCLNNNTKFIFQVISYKVQKHQTILEAQPEIVFSSITIIHIIGMSGIRFTYFDLAG